jgi:hypothetical protein
MHSLTLLVSTEHVHDLQRQASQGRMARAARHSARLKTDSGPMTAKGPLLHRVLNLQLMRRQPEEAPWS